LFQYPELLVASYNNNEESPHEPDGVALIWNLKFSKTTPEYIFHCQVNNHVVCDNASSQKHSGLRNSSFSFSLIMLNVHLFYHWLAGWLVGWLVG